MLSEPLYRTVETALSRPVAEVSPQDLMSAVRGAGVNLPGIYDTAVRIHVAPTACGRFRWLELFSFVLDHQTREGVFTPAFEDLNADYLRAQQYRTVWARRWLSFCFAFRTGVLILDCFQGMLCQRAVRFLVGLIRFW
jgi:hypothetical protein